MIQNHTSFCVSKTKIIWVNKSFFLSNGLNRSTETEREENSKPFPNRKRWRQKAAKGFGLLSSTKPKARVAKKLLFYPPQRNLVLLAFQEKDFLGDSNKDSDETTFEKKTNVVLLEEVSAFNEKNQTEKIISDQLGTIDDIDNYVPVVLSTRRRHRSSLTPAELIERDEAAAIRKKHKSQRVSRDRKEKTRLWHVYIDSLTTRKRKAAKAARKIQEAQERLLFETTRDAKKAARIAAAEALKAARIPRRALQRLDLVRLAGVPALRLAYFAGIIEGDGSLMAIFVPHTKFRFDYNINLTVALTQMTKRRDHMEAFADELGIGCINGKPNEPGMSNLIIKGSRAIEPFLIALLPHLVMKRRQAELILKIIKKNRESRKKTANEFLKICVLAENVSNSNDYRPNKRVHSLETVIKKMVEKKYISEEAVMPFLGATLVDVNRKKEHEKLMVKTLQALNAIFDPFLEAVMPALAPDSKQARLIKQLIEEFPAYNQMITARFLKACATQDEPSLLDTANKEMLDLEEMFDLEE